MNPILRRRYHCEPCQVRWMASTECWVCGHQGQPCALPGGIQGGETVRHYNNQGELIR